MQLPPSYFEKKVFLGCAAGDFTWNVSGADTGKVSGLERIAEAQDADDATATAKRI